MTLDTSPEARHRRLQAALRILKENGRKGGTGVNRVSIRDPEHRQRNLTKLAAAVMNEERRITEGRVA